MFFVSNMLKLGEDMNLVLPEPQYHALLCLHLMKMEAPNVRKLY